MAAGAVGGPLSRTRTESSAPSDSTRQAALKYEVLVPFATYNGHSVGRWEGDALVIESNGFNEDTFLDSTGLPHSDELVSTERIRRINNNQLEDVITIHDPHTYTKDWQARFIYEQRNDIRMQDYSCHDPTHRDISQVNRVNEARAARAQRRFP